MAIDERAESERWTSAEAMKRRIEDRFDALEPRAALSAEQARGVRAPEGWLRAIDEAMVAHHVGIADANDSYETAKDKLNRLLCVAQDIGAHFAAPPPESASEWQPIETAPHAEAVFLASPPNDTRGWKFEVGQASWGWPRNELGISNMSYHGSATHWRPLPAPPASHEQPKVTGNG